MSDPTVHALAAKVAALEERMNTMRVETEAGFERLSKELAQRDKENTRWLFALAVGIVVIMGILIRWLG